MTARASTLEETCSSCRGLVLRAVLEDLAQRPSCSSCGWLVCSECEIGGRCSSCVDDELEDLEGVTLVVVDRESQIGRRPSFFTQPSDGSGR